MSGLHRMPSHEARARDSAEQTVRELNRLWLEGDYEQLGRLFHRDAVLLTPDGERSIVGRDAIVDGYRQFGAMGKINEFEIRALESYPFRASTVCHMHFGIDYEIDSRRYREEGIEVYLLQRAGHRGGWKIVWRTQRIKAERELDRVEGGGV